MDRAVTNAPPARPISVAQFYEGGRRYDHCELWHGGLLVHEPGNAPHGAIASFVMARLARVVDEVRGPSRPWLFAAETGFVLSELEGKVLAPDGAAVLRERLPILPSRGFVPCVPNFVLEVRSTRDSFHGVNAKAGIWIAHGADVVWAVDPPSSTVVVHRAPAEAAEARGADVVDAAPAFPAFRMSVDEIFSSIR